MSNGQDTSWLLPTYLQPDYGSNYIEGGFPAETFTANWLPEPAQDTSWLTSIAKPFADFGSNLFKAGQGAFGAAFEKLPELLWQKYVAKPKENKVDEGAGVTVIHSQAPYAGGTPAQPAPMVIPQFIPTGGAAGAYSGGSGDVDTSTVLIIAAVLAVALIAFGGK